jgi:carbonic anhydrase/acetyltransferase-like protein (isoleucine patch superfamily)
MIKSFDGKTPNISQSAFISQTATIIGDVHIGEKSGVMPGVVIRGDFATIKIGNQTLIEDNAVVHSGSDMEIGDNIIIGHGAVVHGKRIGSNTLVGNNATILDDSEIGDGCVIGAGCLVSPGMKVPDQSMVLGVPGKIAGKVKPETQKALLSGNQAYLAKFDKFKKAGI